MDFRKLSVEPSIRIHIGYNDTLCNPRKLTDLCDHSVIECDFPHVLIILSYLELSRFIIIIISQKTSSFNLCKTKGLSLHAVHVLDNLRATDNLPTGAVLPIAPMPRRSPADCRRSRKLLMHVQMRHGANAGQHGLSGDNPHRIRAPAAHDPQHAGTREDGREGPSQ